MQASQSNNTSDLLTLNLNSDPKDPSFSPTSPSPFAKPIQFARKCIERQSGDAGHTGGRREGDIFEQGALPAEGGSSARKSESPDANLREASSRERDRRLERSLYEGHSIESGLNEAGLSFEGTRTSDANGLAERASLVESDGSESLFPYAIPGPLPDPDVIRGVIFRLTRDSELNREPRLLSEMSSRGLENLGLEDSSAMSPLQPLTFGDVARRVWEANVAPPVAPGTKELELKQETRPTGSANDLTESGTEDMCVEEDDEISFTQSAPHKGAIGSAQAETSINDQKHPESPRVTRSPSLESSPGSRELPTPSVCDVEAEPALAHDACNLLSALSLYSELLGSPGVLQEQYRHYSDELKLMAVRSRALIDRLLQATTMRMEQAPPLGVSGTAAGGIDAVSDHDVLGTVAGSARLDGLHERDPERVSIPSLPSAQAIQSASQGKAHAEPVKAAEVEVATGVASRENHNMVAGSPVVTMGPIALPLAVADHKESKATNLFDLLMRWGGLLSTLAHGTLEVVFGIDAATPVPVGSEAVERILVNLVRNARAATAGGGAIRIGVGMEEAGTLKPQNGAPGTASETTPREGKPRSFLTGGTMVLTVDDSGCGMTDSQIRKALEGDARIEKTTALGHLPGVELASNCDRRPPDKGGVERQALEDAGSQVASSAHRERRPGLGLQIVRELVAASGGKLSIQSSPGRGTRVEIRWQVRAESLVKAGADEIKPKIVEDSAGRLPAILQAAPPVAAPLPLRTGPVELTKGAVGPDGFSEVELRAMMLRLHRAGPQKRSLLSRSLSNWPARTREADREFAAVDSAGDDLERNNPAPDNTEVKGAIAC